MDDSHPEDPLATPVRFVKGVGEKRALLLAKLGVANVEDLLLTLPRRYEDRRALQPLNRVRAGEWMTAQGAIRTAEWIQPRKGRGYFEALLEDGTGLLRCRWYGASWLQDQLAPGDRLVVFGKPSWRRGVVLEHPEFERERDDAEGASLHVGRIVPIYPLTEQLPQRTMRRIQWEAVNRYAPEAPDPLPLSTLRLHGLLERREALWQIHFPSALASARRARDRLVFEEFLCMQLVLVARKIQAERFQKGRAFHPPGRLVADLLRSLPFELTGGQRAALSEIRSDMALPRPMHRLLQGDVGSGKTVVAACAVADCVECGVQAAVLAPTEILAAQHARTLGALLKPLGLRCSLLTGSLDEAGKIAARAALADGRTQVAIGTHALLQERVQFKDLGLIIIDEQHKFGVRQRGALYEKGVRPDVLVMTATPIPRTLAMTLYGDLDVTTIREKPAGRTPIRTRVISEAKLPEAYAFIRRQVVAGRQAYVVYPQIDEGETGLRAAADMFEALRTEAFAGLSVGLLHGRLAPEEKDRVMERFRAGTVQVLVATSVVEVGVDVPNATVMLVEHAERFGLAQLHQLRGRIGRGALVSTCILQGAPRSREAWQRLKVLAETEDGFRIAEEDIRIRGMGNLLGAEQSGIPGLRIGDPLGDQALLEQARTEAFRLLSDDPRLEADGHAALRKRARAVYRAAAGFLKVG